ncbi:ATP-binding cassette domain-containing protein [Coprobacillaceae bacterium CR2/5/TPMF4]|nr:ATP-binding cassette domain-containing protein [Coprobacillaceae bacterium CR2/5/TPMF4]
MALVGVNGTGKSTVLKILAGKENYEGTLLQKRISRFHIYHKILISILIIQSLNKSIMI